jgi:hypothetical protein
MHLTKAIGVAMLFGAPCWGALAMARPAAEASAPRTFTIVPAERGGSRAQFARAAKLVAAELMRKGYRAAAKGQAPDMVVKLRYGGSVLRYRASDLAFVSKSMAYNSATPSEPYPYPSGPAFGSRSYSRTLSWSPAALELSVAVEISSGDGKALLFRDGVRKKISPRLADRVSAELVAAALEKFPEAEG